MKKSLILFLLAISGFCEYSFATNPAEVNSPNFYRRKRDNGHFRFDLSYGLGRRFTSISAVNDAQLASYLDRLKWGQNCSFMATYFFEDKGLGVIVDNFSSKNSTQVRVNYPDATSEVGIMSDNINITFYGLTYSIRRFNQAETGMFIVTMGGGYMQFRNDGRLINPIVIKGESFGGTLNFAYDIKIAPRWWIGIKAGAISGALKHVTANGQVVKTLFAKQESLSRGSLSLGIRLCL